MLEQGAPWISSLLSPQNNRSEWQPCQVQTLQLILAPQPLPKICWIGTTPNKNGIVILIIFGVSLKICNSFLASLSLFHFLTH